MSAPRDELSRGFRRKRSSNSRGETTGEARQDQTQPTSLRAGGWWPELNPKTGEKLGEIKRVERVVPSLLTEASVGALFMLAAPKQSVSIMSYDPAHGEVLKRAEIPLGSYSHLAASGGLAAFGCYFGAEGVYALDFESKRLEPLRKGPVDSVALHDNLIVCHRQESSDGANDDEISAVDPKSGELRRALPTLIARMFCASYPSQTGKR